MFRQRIQSLYVILSLLVLSFLFFFVVPETSFAATAFTVSARQGNIENGKLTVSKGDKVQLVIHSGGRSVSAAGASYKSSKKKVVSVSRSGEIKAKKKGSAVITVSYGGSQCKIKVKVKSSNITMYNAATGFNLTCNKATMNVSRFPLMVKFKNKKKAPAAKVTYTTSNASVATIDKNGVVTLKAPGVVTLKAKYKKKSGNCTIQVTKAASAANTNSAPSVPAPSSGSGSSGTSGSTASGSSGTNVVKETKQKYHYKIEVANRTELYTDYDCVLHVVTDNPNEVDFSAGSETAYINLFVDNKQTWAGQPLYDDIKWVRKYDKVSDGYMYCITFTTPGAHTIAIKELYCKINTSGKGNPYDYEYDVDTDAKITVNVKDSAKEEDAFYKRMLNQYRGATDRDTLQNLADHFSRSFSYQSYLVDGNGSYKKLNLLANYGPWWVTYKDITCYDATDIMIEFATRLGYVAKPFDTGMKDHRVAWVYFDSSKVNVSGFHEEYMEAYDASPMGITEYTSINYLYS